MKALSTARPRCSRRPRCRSGGSARAKASTRPKSWASTGTRPRSSPRWRPPARSVGGHDVYYTMKLVPWTIPPKHGPNHLGLRCNAFPGRRWVGGHDVFASRCAMRLRAMLSNVFMNLSRSRPSIVFTISSGSIPRLTRLCH